MCVSNRNNGVSVGNTYSQYPVCTYSKMCSLVTLSISIFLDCNVMLNWMWCKWHNSTFTSGQRSSSGAGAARGPAVQAAGADPSPGQGPLRRRRHPHQGQGRWTHQPDLRHQAGPLKVTRGLLPEMWVEPLSDRSLVKGFKISLKALEISLGSYPTVSLSSQFAFQYSILRCSSHC